MVFTQGAARSMGKDAAPRAKGGARALFAGPVLWLIWGLIWGLVLLAVALALWRPAGADAVVLGLAGLGLVVWLIRRRQQTTGLRQISAAFAADPAAVIVTDRAGAVVWANAAAGLTDGGLEAALAGVLAEPAPLLRRLIAAGLGVAEVTTAEVVVRLTVWPVPAGLCWRLEQTAAPTAAEGHDAVPVPLMRFAPDGALLSANPAARAALQLERETEIWVHDLFEDLGRPVADWLADVAAGRLPHGAEVMRQRGKGERYFQVTLERLEPQGEVLAILQDATALKRIEAQFAQSQKMQAIGQLAGGIAHDFNNLLTAISGHCDLMLLRHRPDDLDHADLVQIRQNANRAAALVAQLLAFSRKQTLKPERIDLQDALAELTHLLNRLLGEKVRLDLMHARGLGPIRADRRQLEQVIMNLVVNARDAMPEGGTVCITTEDVTLAQPMARDRAVVPPGRYAVIGVADTGVGIPEDRLTKIFEPFFTTKRVGEGTGLGLSMAYGIVKQSGGFIFVDSAPGKGARFQLWFPVHEGPLPAPVPRSPERRARMGEGVVLLVEDEAPVRAFAARALRLRGHVVLEAGTGEEALALLEDADLRVDVFVTDVVMPGLDGPGWVRRALDRRPGVRTVFISGYAEDQQAETQARVPNSVYLPKPFSLTELTDVVQDQMGQA